MMAFIYSTLYDRAREQQRREWRALRDQATLRADAYLTVAAAWRVAVVCLDAGDADTALTLAEGARSLEVFANGVDAKAGLLYGASDLKRAAERLERSLDGCGHE